jgi:signal transduction histidine kinase
MAAAAGLPRQFASTIPRTLMPEIAPVKAPAERRDGRGRDGSANRRGSTRAALVRAGVLPAAAMALLGGVTVGFLQVAGPSLTMTRVVVLAAAAGAALILAGACVGAEAAARSVHDRLAGLRSLHARGLDDLRRLTDAERHGELAAGMRHEELAAGVRHGEPHQPAEGGRRGARPPRGPGLPPANTSDPFELLAYDVRRVHLAARQAVLEIADLTPTADERVEVFVNLAWRMQSLVHREIQLLDELESQVEDPELLKGLFTVDHLATLLRRQTESLAVLGGAASRRRWSSPVTMYDVLRSAVAEVEQYARVKLVLPIDGMVRGDVVAHIIHLVAELVENATKFSPPGTQVLIRAENVSAGLAIEVEDRGLGIPSGDRHRMNEVLADPGRVDIGELLRDGRIGLFVVSALARRHSVRVELQRNVYGGTQAVVVLPQSLVDPAARHRPAIVANGPATPATGPAEPRPEDTTDGTASVVRDAASQAARTPGPRRERPRLPRRRVQESLAPQLRGAPAPRQDDQDAEHTPGLMADFLRGVGRSDEESRFADGTG